MLISRLLESEYSGDRAGESNPGFGFRPKVAAPGAGERIELGAAIVLRASPLGRDQAIVLELVERRIQRSVAHLQRVGGDVTEAMADRPSVHRLQREHLEHEHVERALNEIVRFAHCGLMS